MVLFGCGEPSNDKISKDFNEIYLDTNIISIQKGEGDSDNIYYHIKYKNKNNTLKEKVFLYQYIDDEWIINNQSSK